ncbi:hypothetical protein [Nesterenkonia sp. AN1]|uniref:hypothetical protein n=1 Tax=Nesterenkonia sp. AN1 TaxID=652017 RepID=UPI00126800CA|nr:hypothetical protein [Nesterenkonia sp. AN1]
MAIQRRRSNNIDEAAVEDWGNQAGALPSAEQHKPVSTTKAASVPQPDLPAHRRRAKAGPKKDAVSFRFNTAQRELLNVAVAQADMTQQELLESLIWETLEDRYGHLAEI